MSAGKRTRRDDGRAAAVLYNDGCPVCRREVDHYRRSSERAGAGIAFAPLGQAGAWGLDEDAAARRLHVRLADGRVVSGLPAFLAIWRALPGWRLAARVAGAPGLRGALALLYDRVGGPVLFALHRRRRARRSSPSSTSSTRRSSR